MKGNSSSIADVASDRAKEYMDRGVEVYNQASEQAKKMSKQVDGYVRDNPWTVIGIAAGVGLLLGLMLRRS